MDKKYSKEEIKKAQKTINDSFLANKTIVVSGDAKKFSAIATINSRYQIKTEGFFEGKTLVKIIDNKTQKEGLVVFVKNNPP